MEEPPGTERNNCHCELSRPFMGRIKVNGKPHSSSSPLSKRNAGEGEGRGEGLDWQDCAPWEPGGGRVEACWKQVWGAASIT